MTEAFIGLGSNLGDRLGNLRTALNLIAAEQAFLPRAASRVWESAAVGPSHASAFGSVPSPAKPAPPQPRYLNAVVQVGSLLSAKATLRKLLDIEDAMGRIRGEKWGPREIDLDLLLFGEKIVKGPDLEVPHPLLHHRSFALQPLAEIAPGALHPGLHMTAAQLLAARPIEERSDLRALSVRWTDATDWWR